MYQLCLTVGVSYVCSAGYKYFPAPYNFTCGLYEQITAEQSHKLEHCTFYPARHLDATGQAFAIELRI